MLFRDVSWASDGEENSAVASPSKTHAVPDGLAALFQSSRSQRNVDSCKPRRKAGTQRRHRPQSAGTHRAAALSGTCGRSNLPPRPVSATAVVRSAGPTPGLVPLRPASASTTATRAGDELDVSGVIRRLQRYRPPSPEQLRPLRWDGCNIYVPRPAARASAWPDEAATAQEHQRVMRLKIYASIVIQCAQRQRSARAQARRRRRHCASAVIIQAYGRGYSTRSWMRLRKLSAVRIQAWYRGTLGRRQACTASASQLTSGPPRTFTPPPWTRDETDMLMALVEREGASRWARKALQLGGRRKGEHLCSRYFWVMKNRQLAAVAQAEQEAAESAAQEAEARAKREEVRSERRRVQREKAKAAEARRWAHSAGLSNDRKAVWSIDSSSHNGSQTYTLEQAARHEAEEAAILEVLLRMLQGEKTLYGQKMGSAAAAFAILDKDGSGELDVDELKGGLKRLGLGLSESQIGRLAATLDEDDNGQVSLAEFQDGLEKAVKVRRRRVQELRQRLNATLESGRSTTYARPWTERPKEMTPIQLMQRAARRAVSASFIV